MRGVELITLKELLEHSRVVMTKVYAHVCGAHPAGEADLLALARPRLTLAPCAHFGNLDGGGRRSPVGRACEAPRRAGTAIERSRRGCGDLSDLASLGAQTTPRPGPRYFPGSVTAVQIRVRLQSRGEMAAPAGGRGRLGGHDR